ncbi:hypothetical protein WOLCODRAFT_116843 [Wolfiporia cocos MD-104 SS10]|uniref:Nucleolar protein 12 n=1 Tax=Wolfiporia cocos (strain MD-104) TaxID=742152 RepID=A0A2H3JD54_WOLCO|nr:hypothetical protein WOLCODRAFT_116843 [Wolfiporia cocos MD-104 SS10]
MSLSSFLLEGKKDKGVAIDKSLDDLFQSTAAAGPSTSVQPVSTSSLTTKYNKPKKRKLSVSILSAEETTKRPRSEKEGEQVKETAKNKRKEKEIVAVEEGNNVPQGARKKAKPTRSSPHKDTKADTDDSDDDEAAHRASRSAQKATTSAPASEYQSDSDDEGDPSKLVHETLANGTKPKNSGRSTKVKTTPPDETPERRNARTLFVGNVPIDVAKSRPLQKQFKRHILSFVPTAKIESLRFRSVAFQNPTTKLPSPDDDKAKEPKKAASKKKEKEKDDRQHGRERAASWRAAKGAQDEEEPGKTFLTPKEKRRIAFIKHELHSEADVVNAYIVFAHPIPAAGLRSPNVPPPPPTMDPYEAAKAAAEKCDGTVFMERTIRADRAGKDGEESMAGMAGDPKCTVFVGNLDFASKEEDLRVFFEGLIVAERGAPGERNGSDSDEEDEEEEGANEQKETDVRKPRTWVKRVRIVRDKDTQLGKGFAYVQFVDRECVDEVFALEESRLKFAKRKLRVQRCKTVPGGAKVTPKNTKSSASTSDASAPKRAPRTSGATPVPKGNPALGEKIKDLSKEDRKKVKAADADRVARRLAKKKAKILAEKGVKAHVERERVRKRPAEKKGKPPTKEKSKKRVRSGKALVKMNNKK